MAQWVFRALGSRSYSVATINGNYLSELTFEFVYVYIPTWVFGQLAGYGQPSSLAHRVVNGNLFPLPTWAISHVCVCVV